MKGLLLKDYYMAIKYCRPFILIAVVFIGVSVVSDSNAFMMLYPVIICAMIPVTLIGYEERSHWTMYCQTFPYSKSQIVSCKYVLAAIIVTAVTVFTAAAQAIRLFGTGTMAMTSYMNMIAMLVMMGLAGPALLLPFVFKYGVEKGRIAYYIVICAVCAIGAILAMEDQNILYGVSAQWMPVLFWVIGIGVFVLSWRLSIRFYESREI